MKLIFIHGSGGSKHSWYYQTKHFPDADAVELPGHPEGEPCTSVEAYVDWLKGYIDEKGYRDVVLAGHSLGGAVAQLYALTHPEDMAGLILIGSGARLRVHPMYLDGLRKAIDNPAAFVHMREAGWNHLDPELRELLRERAARIGPAVALNDMLCCDRFDIMERVHQIKMPTLALCGTEDAMTPPKYAKYLVDKIDGARQVTIEGGTHDVSMEKPDEVNRAIEDFLSTIPTAAG